VAQHPDLAGDRVGILSVAAADPWPDRSAVGWQRWRWIGLHLTAMSASYIPLLTAIYVDNGKHLPIWRALPHMAYWLLPSAVGLPWSLARWPATAAWHLIGPPTPRPLTDLDPQPQPQPRVIHQPLSRDPSETMAAACRRDGAHCQYQLGVGVARRGVVLLGA
jgi:hypothetical protein